MDIRDRHEHRLGALNKAMGITFSTVPAIRIEDFDRLVGDKA